MRNIGKQKTIHWPLPIYNEKICLTTLVEFMAQKNEFFVNFR